jgi:type IV secretion system protein VirB4
VLQDGVDTKFNPLKGLSGDNPRDMAMLRYIARGIIGGEIDQEDQRSIAVGLKMVMEMPVRDRSWGEVRGFLGYAKGGIGERLEPWCRGGEFGWALDCDEDTLSYSRRVTGYDTTGIVPNPIAKGPIQAYMSYRMETMIDGRRIIIVVDEAHHWVDDPFWGRRAVSLSRTIRRRNGVLGLLTQHPSDIAKSPFGHAIMQQMPQQFFFPDPRGKPEDYVGGAQITETMFDFIKRRMQAGSGMFLRVIDGEAMVCELPLGGLDAHIAVLSSRDATVKLAEEIRAEHGAGWVNQFMQRHAEAAP